MLTLWTYDRYLEQLQDEAEGQDVLTPEEIENELIEQAYLEG